MKRFNLVVLGCALCSLGQLAHAQSWNGGDVPNGNLNWSDTLNWTGGVAPSGATAVVTFPDGAYPVSTNGAGLVNNIVQANTIIDTLAFQNNAASGHYNTTFINTGVTLQLDGGMSVGVNSGTAMDTSVTMTGGGSLIVGANGGASFSLDNGTGSTTPASLLDLSGLSSFVFNIVGSSSGTFTMGGGGSGSANTLNLAGVSNNITCGTFNVGNNNTRGGNTLNLGNGTNIINADTVNVGISKTSGTIQFLNNAGGGLKIASHTGTGRATVTIGGEANTGSTTAVNSGTMALNSGTVNILASTLKLADRAARASGSAVGVLSFSSGVVDATTIVVSTNQSGGSAPNGSITNAGGLLRIGSGGMSLANDNGLAGSGTLVVYNNGSVICSNNIFKQTSVGTATITLYGGASLTMASTAGTIGVVNGLPIDNFNLTNTTLTLPAQTSAAIEVVNFNPDVTNIINVSALPSITTAPTPTSPYQVPIIHYQVAGSSGAGPLLNSIGLGTLPNLFQGFISNNVLNSSIDLVITNGPAAKPVTWIGNVSGVWDTTTANWQSGGIPTNYLDLDFVTFDDNGLTGAVSVSGKRTPGSLTFNNSTVAYALSGTGSISGPTSLQMSGTNSVTLSESGGDNFSGGITVNSGMLVLDQSASSITGGLTIQGGAKVQIGNNDSNGNLPGGTLQDDGLLIFDRANNLTVSAVIQGAGAVYQNGGGILTLSGANSYTGATEVNAGTMALTGSDSLPDTSQITVTNSILDVSGLTGTFTLPTVTLNNGQLTVSIGYLQTNVNVSTLNLTGPTNLINVRALPPIATYPATITLVNATLGINGTTLGLGTLPNTNYAGTLAVNSQSVVLNLTSGPIGTRPSVDWVGTDAANNVNTNWTDPQNWQSPGAPATNEPVSFTATGEVFGTPFQAVGDGSGGVVSPTYIDNIVNVAFTNTALSYTSPGAYHNTLIASNQSLTINGSVTVTGASTTTSILGTNASLQINNPANASHLYVENGLSTTLDLSGLGTLNAHVSQLAVGLGSSSGNETLYLAETNIIMTGNGFTGGGAALVVGNGNANAELFLGQSNALFVDGIIVGVGASGSCEITFNPNLTNPTAYIRGINGNSSRVTQWALGDNTVNLNNTHYGSLMTNDFTAGTLDALVGTMTIGQGAQGNIAVTTPNGVFNMGAGNLDVATLRIGVAAGGATGDTGIGIMNVTGGTVIANTLSMGVSVSGGTGTTEGTLDLTNATLVASNGITIGTGTAGGIVSEVNSTIKLLNGSIGAFFNALTELDLNGGSLQLYVDGNSSSPDIVAQTITSAGTTTINIASVLNVATNASAQIPLISYASGDPFSSLALGSLPPGYMGRLVDNTANATVDLALGPPPASPPVITGISISGTTLNLHGTNGTSGGQYVLLGSTNLTLPLNQWTPVLTNHYNSDGSFSVSTNVINPAVPQEFFILVQ